MRCQPVACLWYDGGGPPIHHHKITAHAILNEPTALYTGASDGSIVWWNINDSQTSTKRIWPMAMLCGHAAAIVGLEICSPIATREEIHKSWNSNSTLPASTALLSACADGLLCVWSRGSGHCRRRRKLPPWVGTPCILSSLPLSTQYVCVACNFADAFHHSAEAGEVGNGSHLQSEAATDKEILTKRTSGCAVVIVDSRTLNIVRIIAHGNLIAAPLTFMAVVPSCDDAGKQSVIVVDALGKMQSMAIPESDSNGEPRSALQTNSSHVGPIAESENLQLDGSQAASVSANGHLLALVFRTQCTFKSMTNMTTIGVICLNGSSLCNDDCLTPAFPIGGMFLRSHCSPRIHGSPAPGGGPGEKFAVWSNTGAAIVYKVFISVDAFDFERLFEIPATTGMDCIKMSISFGQSNYYVFRMESLCFEMHASTLWQPRVSIWSVTQLPTGQIDSIETLGVRKSNNSDDSFSCIMVGEGSFLADGIGRTSALSETVALNSSAPQDSFLSSGRIISSSLVLSEEYYVPHAVVYGFYSGEIELVCFELFHDDDDERLHQRIGLHNSEQSFLGHRGAVLCLAAHHMASTSSELNFKHVLISGSSDCTIRIWDLVSGILLSVMQHHIAPVKQVILPPSRTCHPWSDCFLSVGEDFSVALASLETLRVERIFPGHPSYPVVVWDSTRGYIACLCRGISTSSDPTDALYLWDVKTGARERVLRGNASHSMFDHFCRGINVNSITGNVLGGSTSASSLLLPVNEDASFMHSHTYIEMGTAKSTSKGNAHRRTAVTHGSDVSVAHDNKGKILISRTSHEFSSHVTDHSFIGKTSSHAIHHDNLIKCFCPYPGIATLKFDLASLMHSHPWHEKPILNDGKQENAHISGWQLDNGNFHLTNSNGGCDLKGSESQCTEERIWVRSSEGYLLRFSISFLHLWDVDHELDKLLADEMNICKPKRFLVASGLQGDSGSLTLAFPGMGATLELWRSSSEFCAMRSLAMVSLDQGMIRLSRSSSIGSSALAAFYTRNFAEKVPDLKPPLLQLLVSFWQDPSEHIRMAARSLFHCAVSRSIPLPLSGPRLTPHVIHSSFINGDIYTDTGDAPPDNLLGSNKDSETQVDDELSALEWMESFEMQDWVSCIGGTGQDAMSSHIIVAAALVVWYPSLVKPNLSKLVVHPLMKLVMAMSDKYSSTAAELLAEGMESTWKACIGPEIPQLITDIFYQIECLSGAPANKATQNSSLAMTMRESLAGILLPSLAMADISGFINVIESQIWATASDSPVHLVSLMTLIRIIRGSPKPFSLHLDKAVNFILQTMDHRNSVMRRTCLQSSMAALREVVRVFPMVALNEASTRLAVGDNHSAHICIYDMQSLTKIKILDASGPPGLPNLLKGASDTTTGTVISALCFSPDGEGLVAFSEHGLMIRWWSLGTGWWEKLSRNIVPVQCTKLIFVPPWEGFSPSSSRSSIMASIISNDSPAVSPGQIGSFGDTESSKLLTHNLDLSYRLQWVNERKVMLSRHGQELGSFQF